MAFAGRLAGKAILIVEDEYFIASDLKRALIGDGAVVIGPTGRMEKALAFADESDLDAAILDVNLEGATSFCVADRLTERGVPCLFVTGYDAWAMPEPYRAAPLIAKPFAMQAVLDTLATLTDKGLPA